MLTARSTYTEWHQKVYTTDTDLLPIPKEKVKSFCLDLYEAGDAPSTIMYLFLTGLYTWVSFLDLLMYEYCSFSFLFF